MDFFNIRDTSFHAPYPASQSFQFSLDWIAAEEQRMRDAGESELDILQMKRDAYERLNSRRDQGIYLLEDQKRAADGLAESERQLIEAMKEEVRAGLQREKQADLDRITADRDREVAAIRAKIDALREEADAQDYLRRLEQERADLAELVANRNKVAADKRFTIIETDAAGQLVKKRVADTARLAELDKQIANQRGRIEEMERDERIRQQTQALEDEIKRVEDAADRKMKAQEAYWDALLAEERLTADIQHAIQAQGMANTLATVQEYTAKIIAEYKRAQAQVMGGISLPSVGTIGCGTPRATTPTAGGALVGGLTGIFDGLRSALASPAAALQSQMAQAMRVPTVSSAVLSNVPVKSQPVTQTHDTHIHGPITVKADNLDEFMESVRRAR